MRTVFAPARAAALVLLAGLCVAVRAEPAASPLPPEVARAFTAAGVPLKHVGVYVRAVDGDTPQALAALNEDQPFLLASTAKVVTSLAALRLLGSRSHWRSQAYTTAPVVGGRVAGDLVIVGSEAGLTSSDLRRWFQQMRSEGLKEVDGRIVLDHVAVLQDVPMSPAQARDGGGAERPAGGLQVRVAPGAGGRAQLQLQPSVPGALVVNDVVMGGGCAVYARWSSPPAEGRGGVATVSGRWDRRCGARVAARLPWDGAPAAVQAPAAVTPASTVAALWSQSGGRLGRGVVALEDGPRGRTPKGALWRSALSTSLPERLREMNKASLNLAAQRLLLSLAGPPAGAPPALRARQRMQQWLQAQGLGDEDMRIELGSGQSRNERGKPRAMVQLLRQAWPEEGTRHLIESLPVAGVDGTLANRMQKGMARGRAFLKTGTLRDTRSLAGYVTGRSGTTYAVAALVNHPQAARATPALDALIEWVARNG